MDKTIDEQCDESCSAYFKKCGMVSVIDAYRAGFKSGWDAAIFPFESRVSPIVATAPISGVHSVAAAPASAQQAQAQAQGGTVPAAAGTAIQAPRKHSHYFKNVEHLQTIDVYRVLALFQVTDPCLQHAVKKLLVAGGRGAGKDIGRDVKEAVDSLVRWQEMRLEDEEALK